MLKESDDQDPYNLTFRGSDDQSLNNWRRLWETNNKSRRWAARAWLQQFSSNRQLSRTLSTPPSTYDILEAVVMLNNPMHQTPENKFLHWCQEMERKQEEQVRQVQELLARAKRLQREND